MRSLIVVAAVALGACTPDAQPGAARVNPAACLVTANDMWRPLSGAEFSVEATSSGPDCERAVATLVIRDTEGDVLWAEAYATAHVMLLAPARDAAAMQTALGEWINSTNNTMDTTSALPDWPANATGPVSGEFPFYLEEGYDRETYLAVRQSNLPLFCYVQGMESMACLALEDGALVKVGVQLFPG